MTRHCFLLVIGLIGLTTPADAGTFKQTKGPATLEVRWDASGRKLALADQITVTLRIEGSPALDVYGAPLELGAQAKWILFERSRDTKETIGLKRVRWQLVYHFAPREPGQEVAFAFPEVKFRDGKEYAVSWKPIPFEVVSEITAPDPTKLKGVPTIEELPPIVPPEESAWILFLLAGCLLPLLLVAISGLWLVLRRAPSRSAIDLAFYELQRLVGMKLPEKGRSERFITLLTMIVRRYLERQYALPARRQTTPEFVCFLTSCETLTSAEKEFLTTFLRRCEAVKFANTEMSIAECNQWEEATRRFLAGRKVVY
jgi:hypothetical protein